MPFQGLSPRVRGKPQGCGCPPAVLRSIPACAGEAPLPLSIPPRRRVYPRVCGGSPRRHFLGGAAFGLSPRVRGKRRWSASGKPSGRSIPACAGEAPLHRELESIAQVYPRVCGGSAAAAGLHQGGGGLSPRVRGKPPARRAAAGFLGSIPACAGEAARRSQGGVLLKVYPRVCGGSRPASQRKGGKGGLSPRVRGKRRPAGESRRRGRSIPACAGEAHRGSRGRPGGEVYPRVCGGSGRVVSSISATRGLSPRVRGKRWRPGESGSASRSIPACAGEATDATDNLHRQQVYPRVCGGSHLCYSSPPGGSGLSPRVRGKPAVRQSGRW